MENKSKRILNKKILVDLENNANIIETYSASGIHKVYLVRDCPNSKSKYSIVIEMPLEGSVLRVTDANEIGVAIEYFKKIVNTYEHITKECNSAIAKSVEMFSAPIE